MRHRRLKGWASEPYCRFTLFVSHSKLWRVIILVYWWLLQLLGVQRRRRAKRVADGHIHMTAISIYSVKRASCSRDYVTTQWPITLPPASVMTLPGPVPGFTWLPNSHLDPGGVRWIYRCSTGWVWSNPKDRDGIIPELDNTVVVMICRLYLHLKPGLQSPYCQMTPNISQIAVSFN